jgi:CRISPR/Cas system-associated endoribonuclease Cas2
LDDFGRKFKLYARFAFNSCQPCLSMKKLLFTAFFLLFTLVGFAQEQTPDQAEALDRLLKERSELIKEYNYLNAQNSNFWGKKSKKDLLKIIDTLKGIIKKDSEIINNIQSYTVRRKAELTVKEEKIVNEVQQNKRFITDQVFELNRQLKSAQNLTKVKDKKIRELEELVKTQKAAHYERDRVIVVLAGLIVILLLYLIILRRKLPAAKRKPKPKTNRG